MITPHPSPRPVPQLRATGTGAQFIVDGDPVLLLGGQVHNSVPSSPEHARKAFGHLAAMHATTGIGILIAEGDDTFLLAGQGVTVDFSWGLGTVEVDHVEEGRFTGAGWIPGRVLNGDERLQVLPLDDVGSARIRLLRIPAR